MTKTRLPAHLDGATDGPERCEDILQCVLTLSRTEAHAYRALVKKGPMRTEALAEEIGRDRSTASRCLKRLLKCGICMRRTAHMEHGGYYYVYEALPPEQVREKLKRCTKDWFREMSRTIEGFPYD